MLIPIRDILLTVTPIGIAGAMLLAAVLAFISWIEKRNGK